MGLRKKEEKSSMKIRGSRKLYLPLYIMVLILVGAIIWIKYQALSLNDLALVLAIIFIVIIIKYTELHRFNNLYEITTSSVVHTHGIIGRKTRNIDFFAISDTDFTQNPWQRLLNFGDVNVRLYSQETNASIKNINNPKNFVSFLDKMINARRRQNVGW